MGGGTKTKTRRARGHRASRRLRVEVRESTDRGLEDTVKCSHRANRVKSSVLMVAVAVLADPEPMLTRLVRGCIALAVTACSHRLIADAVKGGKLSYMALAMQREQTAYISVLMMAGAVLADPEPMLARLVRGCIALAFTACVAVAACSHRLAHTFKRSRATSSATWHSLAMQREQTTSRTLLLPAGAVLADPEPMLARLVRGCIALAFTACVAVAACSHRLAHTFKRSRATSSATWHSLAMQREQTTSRTLLLPAGAVLADPEPMLARLVRGFIALAFTACVYSLLHAVTVLLIPSTAASSATWHWRCNASKSGTARYRWWRGRSWPTLSRCDLVCHVSASPWPSLLAYTRCCMQPPPC